MMSPEQLKGKIRNVAKEKGLLIAAHREDNSLLKGGYIHDGEYAAKHGL